MKFLFLHIFALMALTFPGFALQPKKGSLFVRVVDTGAGLCCVLCLPNEEFVIFDAGNYEPDAQAYTVKAVGELIKDHAPVELLVLSHSDSDHAGAVKEICSKYAVRRVLRPGLARDSKTWKDAVKAVEFKSRDGQCRDLNLATLPIEPGTTYRFGPVFATMLSGFDTPPKDWDVKGDSEKYNAGSIVMRFQYDGRSVLICGDAVGRHINDPETVCIDTERFVVDMGEVMKIQSDVLVASHHGADNGSSLPFLQAVKPSYGVFSAGHKFEHPRRSAVERFIKAGIDLNHQFRTDRGDQEGNQEWPGGAPGVIDLPGDDDVDILIEPGHDVLVQYRNP